MRRFYGGRSPASGKEPHAVREAWGQNFRRAAPRKLAPSGGREPHAVCEAWGQNFRRAAPRKLRPLGGQRATRSERTWGLIIRLDGPSRMVKRPTGSDGEPSSPNCGASAGVKARQPHSACAPEAPSEPSASKIDTRQKPTGQ